MCIGVGWWWKKAVFNRVQEATRKNVRCQNKHFFSSTAVHSCRNLLAANYLLRKNICHIFTRKCFCSLTFAARSRYFVKGNFPASINGYNAIDIMLDDFSVESFNIEHSVIWSRLLLSFVNYHLKSRVSFKNHRLKIVIKVPEVITLNVLHTLHSFIVW